MDVFITQMSAKPSEREAFAALLKWEPRFLAKPIEELVNPANGGADARPPKKLPPMIPPVNTEEWWRFWAGMGAVWAQAVSP